MKEQKERITMEKFVFDQVIALTWEKAMHNPHMEHDPKHPMFHYSVTLKRYDKGHTFDPTCNYLDPALVLQRHNRSKQLLAWAKKLEFDKIKPLGSMSLSYSKGMGHVEQKPNGQPRTRPLWNGSIHDPAGHIPIPPSADEVLNCLAMDAASIENNFTFEEWASEMGYDTDSRKAVKLYEACREETDKLKRLLGREAFELLLWGTESL